MSATPEFLQTWTARVDATLRNTLAGAAADPRFGEAMAYCVFGGGKRLRPALAYLSTVACEVDPVHADLPAAAIELIHAYSLVHDDLPAMDDDDLRRGKPTCHKQYDEATAILAGDALLTTAFETLARVPTTGVDAQTALELISNIGRAVGAAGMVHGQVTDLAAETRTLNLDELRAMHTAKTGALITVSTMVGPILAGLDEDEAQGLRSYGEALGLAFQIRDDILDVEGDPAEIGKLPSDTRNAKATFVSSLGLDGAKAQLHATVGQAHAALATLDNRAHDLRTLVDFVASRTH